MLLSNIVIQHKINKIAPVSTTTMFHKTPDKTAYYVISKKPLIITTVWDLWEYHGTKKVFSKIFSNKKAYFLFFFWWSVENIFIVNYIQFQYKRYRKKFPKHNLIFLCNTKKQHELFQRYNLPSIFCNQNSLIDENIFTIMPKIKKKYDAIYNAQMAPFKRHRLASEIDNLALITYFDGVKSKKSYYDRTKKLLSKAKWINQPLLEEQISSNKVVKYLNQARTGLCLSALEGSMYASVEYLLCGLPVISTKSKGGRDVFFDKKYVKIVNANPETVKKAVNEMIKKSVPSKYIRVNTIKKMISHRNRFIALIQNIYDKEHVKKTFEKEWNKKFVNKMLKWQEIDLLSSFI